MVYKMIEIDFKQEREDRRDVNKKIVRESLINGDLKTLHENTNPKAYKEFLEILESHKISEKKFLQLCNEFPWIADISTCNTISINASRQGSKDEAKQIEACKTTAKEHGTDIVNLSNKALRATKDGNIISEEERKEKDIKKHECLKSFDAEMKGEINGYIAAKVVYGSGGHQDNVFEEMDTLAEWWKTYKCGSKEILVILIDTDLSIKFKELKEKYKLVENVKVLDHIEFQKMVANLEC